MTAITNENKKALVATSGDQDWGIKVNHVKTYVES